VLDAMRQIGAGDRQKPAQIRRRICSCSPNMLLTDFANLGSSRPPDDEAAASPIIAAGGPSYNRVKAQF
jgi:hypothetical protein